MRCLENVLELHEGTPGHSALPGSSIYKLGAFSQTPDPQVLSFSPCPEHPPLLPAILTNTSWLLNPYSVTQLPLLRPPGPPGVQTRWAPPSSGLQIAEARSRDNAPSTVCSYCLGLPWGQLSGTGHTHTHPKSCGLGSLDPSNHQLRPCPLLSHLGLHVVPSMQEPRDDLPSVRSPTRMSHLQGQGGGVQCEGGPSPCCQLVTQPAAPSLGCCLHQRWKCHHNEPDPQNKGTQNEVFGF